MTPRRLTTIALLLALVGVGVWKGPAVWTWATTRVVYERAERFPEGAVVSWIRFQVWRDAESPINVSGARDKIIKGPGVACVELQCLSDD